MEIFPQTVAFFPCAILLSGLSLNIHVVISLTKSGLVISHSFNQQSDLYPHFNYKLIIVL